MKPGGLFLCPTARALEDESALFSRARSPGGRWPGRSTMFDGAPHSPRRRARAPLFSRARFPGGDDRGALLCSTARRTRHADGRERRFSHARDSQGCDIWALDQANGARPRFARPRFPHTQRPHECHAGPAPRRRRAGPRPHAAGGHVERGNIKSPGFPPLPHPARPGRNILRSTPPSF